MPVQCKAVAHAPLSISGVLRHPARLFFDCHGTVHTAPFLDIKFRSRIRVIDFDPPDIRDFARSPDDETYNPANSNGGGSFACSPGSDDGDSQPDPDCSPRPNSNWEWAFRLLVEDWSPSDDKKSSDNRQVDGQAGGQSDAGLVVKPAKPRIELTVSGKEAIYLLSLDPTE